MLRMLLFLSLLCPALVAQETEPAADVEAPAGVPKAVDLVSDFVKGLPAPSAPAVPNGVTMAVTADNEEAQASVRHGLVCLHTGWDFEAYRHFCAALDADPNCLMAHWGIAMALIHGSQDKQEERRAAMDRMLALVEEGFGTELEKRYVFALAKLVTDSPAVAADAFRGAAEEFPADPQIRLLTCLLSRGGFDINGDATPDQQRAEASMRETIEKHPDLTWLRYALLAMRAEAGDLQGDLEMARGLCNDAPGYAPYFHLLGHYEWRCGNHTRAANAFGRASDLYGEWMQTTGVKAVHCPQWTKAECYRAVALASKGEYETALAVAEGVAGIEVSLEQAVTDGGRMLLWEGRTLPVRLLMRRGGAGDMARAVKLLPAAKEVEPFGKKTLALWSFQMHSSVVAGKRALEGGEINAAREVAMDVTRIGENFVKTREVAAANGERSHWLRAFKAFEVMASELRGMIGMKESGGPSVSAASWFQSAADRQARATLLMPPMTLLPMECRQAEYELVRKEPAPDKAIEVLESGLEAYPNDFELMIRLRKLYQSGGRAEDAAAIQKRIDALEVE